MEKVLGDRVDLVRTPKQRMAPKKQADPAAHTASHNTTAVVRGHLVEEEVYVVLRFSQYFTEPAAGCPWFRPGEEMRRSFDCLR